MSSKKQGREMPARSRSFLFFRPPLSSSRISLFGKIVAATRRKHNSSSVSGIRIFPLPSFVLPAHENDNALLVSKLRYHLPFPLGWIFPIPFFFRSPFRLIHSVFHRSSFLSFFSFHTLIESWQILSFCIPACYSSIAFRDKAENERQFKQF